MVRTLQQKLPISGIPKGLTWIRVGYKAECTEMLRVYEVLAMRCLEGNSPSAFSAAMQ